MANNLQHRNVQATVGPSVRDRSPDATAGGSSCFAGFLCFGSRKRGKRIVPATRLHDGSGSSSRQRQSNTSPQPGTSNQYTSFSPSLLAPPSSPASFQNSGVQSSAQSPATFPIALSVPSTTSQISLESSATMFQMGPYAHETALVSPPVFSTFTTAPSTAPFTPPPELATHFTTPSSPEVPFAQLLASSFGANGSVRSQPSSTKYSTVPFAPPELFSADDLQTTYQLYPGSPLAHLLSPTSGTGGSTPFPDLDTSSQCAPFPDLENSVRAVATMFFPGSPDPATGTELEVGSLLSQALASCSCDGFRDEEQQMPATISSFVDCGDDSLGHTLVGHTDCDFRVRLIREVNRGSDGWQKTNRSNVFGRLSDLNEEGFDEVTGDFRNKQEYDTGDLGWFLCDDISSIQQQGGNCESSDQNDDARNHSQINVLCDKAVKTFPSTYNGAVRVSAELTVRSEADTLESGASLFDSEIGEAVTWGTLEGNDIPGKLSTPQSGWMEIGRTETSVHGTSESKRLALLRKRTLSVTGPSDDGDCPHLNSLSSLDHQRLF